MSKQTLGSIAEIQAFVGQPAVVGDAILIDQATVDAFAAVTRDHQWIHVDPERAATESPFGTTIAHGLLTLGLITGWYNQCFDFPNRKMGLNYGFDRIRFTAPVPTGSELVGSFQLKRVEPLRDDEIRCVWQIEVRVVGAERPALVAEWLTQLRY